MERRRTISSTECETSIPFVRRYIDVVYIDIEERKKTRRVRGMTDKENVDFKDSTFPPCGLGSRETEKEGGREKERKKERERTVGRQSGG